MLEIGILYEENSLPFQRVYQGSLKVGKDYFNEEGHRIRYLGNDRFEFIKRSPLVPGELMRGLQTKIVQKLFWTLAKIDEYRVH